MPVFPGLCRISVPAHQLRGTGTYFIPGMIAFFAKHWRKKEGIAINEEVYQYLKGDTLHSNRFETGNPSMPNGPGDQIAISRAVCSPPENKRVRFFCFRKSGFFIAGNDVRILCFGPLAAKRMSGSERFNEEKNASVHKQ